MYASFFINGDLTDSLSLIRLIERLRPDEIYNLGAQSHVAVSFESPEYTANADALGALRILEAIRSAGLKDKTRFYQASTSELFGKGKTQPQSEDTPFYPGSPYGVAKLYAYWITVNYREAYGMFACNGILFNHESPVRGETFVTRKITRGLARVVLGLDRRIYLGNLEAKRDWGHARDYVEAQWLILQQEKPEDFVIATGEQRTVREFCEAACEELGVFIEWRGRDEGEYGVITRLDRQLIRERLGMDPAVDEGYTLFRVDPRYFRPSEVESLVGDFTKARTKLGWSPKTSWRELVSEMVTRDVELASMDILLQVRCVAFFRAFGLGAPWRCKAFPTEVKGLPSRSGETSSV